MQDKLLVSVKDLNMVFDASVHRFWNWRDVFVSAFKHPLDTFLPHPDKLHVLKDVNFEMHRGDRVGLLGVNGVGKTTLCRLLSGFYAPTSGSITVNGTMRAIFDVSLGVKPELTGRENAHLLSYLMFPDESDKEGLVEEALAFSELGRFLDMPYRVYSNGMQTRLCLSLISSRPFDVLIMDEVFDGADAFFKQKITGRVTEMIKKSGTVMFVSHSPDQIRQVCSRLLVLHQGGLAFDGDVEKGIAFYESIAGDTQPGAGIE